jgi:hypothetical protein
MPRTGKLPPNRIERGTVRATQGEVTRTISQLADEFSNCAMSSNAIRRYWQVFGGWLMAESSSPLDELRSRLSEYPEEALAYFDSGFTAASTLSASDHALIIKEIIVNFGRGTRRLDGRSLRSIVALSTKAAEQVASTYTVAIGLLSETTATPEDFVNAAKGTLFRPENESTARTVAEFICASRAELDLAVERAQIAGQILPSFASLDLAVDVRLRITNGVIKTAVPLFVVHIDTDTDEHLWFQMTQGDVRELIKKLTRALEDVDVAETFLPKKA